MERRSRVIILGEGFSGLEAAQQINHSMLNVALIDRQNYCTSQPLLHQVATE